MPAKKQSNHTATRSDKSKTGQSRAMRKPGSFLLIPFLVITLIFGGLLMSRSESAAGGIRSDRIKVFRAITVRPGDTLWSIAETYRTFEYPDIQSYISELQAMNQLTDSTIYAGCRLVIASYIEP